MLKSICIKTNDSPIINYLLSEFDKMEITNTYYSCRKFKYFTNLIVHHKGDSHSFFLSSLSKILTYLILDLFENKILEKIIDNEYFYFSEYEQNTILKICIDNLNSIDSLERFEIIEKSFYEYLNKNITLNLKGFIDFRLNSYIKYLEEIVDLCVNKFIIDKEYFEFINLLKSYVNSSECSSSTIHLIYKSHESILLDEQKNIIPQNKDVFNVPFLSDISFSSNDYTLNSLLSILPKTIYIHLIEESDEFIDTLKLIFENRIHICSDCDICRTYKKQKIQKVKS